MFSFRYPLSLLYLYNTTILSICQAFFEKKFIFFKKFFLVKLHKMGSSDLCNFFAKKLLTFGSGYGIIVRGAAIASAVRALVI